MIETIQAVLSLMLIVLVIQILGQLEFEPWDDWFE